MPISCFDIQASAVGTRVLNWITWSAKANSLGRDQKLVETPATALLALASSEASAFVCQAVGVRSRTWGRSFYVVEAKLMALDRCVRRSGIFTISYCRRGY